MSKGLNPEDETPGQTDGQEAGGLQAHVLLDPSFDFARSRPVYPSGYYIDEKTGVLMTPGGEIAHQQYRS